MKTILNRGFGRRSKLDRLPIKARRELVKKVRGTQTYDQIQKWLADAHGTSASVEAISKFFHRLQKLSKPADAAPRVIEYDLVTDRSARAWPQGSTASSRSGGSRGAPQFARLIRSLNPSSNSHENTV